MKNGWDVGFGDKERFWKKNPEKYLLFLNSTVCFVRKDYKRVLLYFYIDNTVLYNASKME